MFGKKKAPELAKEYQKRAAGDFYTDADGNTIYVLDSLADEEATLYTLQTINKYGEYYMYTEYEVNL